MVMSWSRAFHLPILLPDGRVLRTLRDIQELPKAVHQRPEWQIAAEMLLEAVEGKGLPPSYQLTRARFCF